MTPVLLISGQKFPAIFRRLFGILTVLQHFYLYIPRFLAEPLTMFCETLVGKHWSILYCYWRLNVCLDWIKQRRRSVQVSTWNPWTFHFQQHMHGPRQISVMPAIWRRQTCRRMVSHARKYLYIIQIQYKHIYFVTVKKVKATLLL
jgi:hypothetical protein